MLPRERARAGLPAGVRLSAPTAAQIAERALALADRFLVEGRDEIAGMATEDGRVLYDAAQIVRTQADGGAHGAHSAEHLAFSLIAAAHELLRTTAKPAPRAETPPA